MESNLDNDISLLYEERKKLDEKINQLIQKKYKKYEGMSSEVKDDNPYRSFEKKKKLKIFFLLKLMFVLKLFILVV